jgi:hypothetical protein
MIKRYDNFLNESRNNFDLDEIMRYVHNNLSGKEIKALNKEIEQGLISESLNENKFRDLLDRFGRWFDDLMMRRFINKKKDFYLNLVGKLEKYNLETLADVKREYPRFKELLSIYLAGGMDKAADVGKGWRDVVEYIFEIEHPGKKRGLEDISLTYDGKTYDVSPSYVIDDYHLAEALELGLSYIKENYDAPAIFNPVRKEMDRTKNPDFAAAMSKFKSGDYTENDDFAEISRVFSETIEPDDEKIVALCDAIFYGANEYTNAGTFGELQQSSFQRIPIFAWYEEGWDIHGHSPWSIPHITKIMRSENEVRTFVKTMINYAK